MGINTQNYIINSKEGSSSAIKKNTSLEKLFSAKEISREKKISKNSHLIGKGHFDEEIVEDFVLFLLDSGVKKPNSLVDYCINSRLDELTDKILSNNSVYANGIPKDQLISINGELIDKNTQNDYRKYKFFASFTNSTLLQYMKELVFIECMIDSDCIDYSSGYPDFTKCSEIDINEAFKLWIGRETNRDLESRGYLYREDSDNYFIDDWNSVNYNGLIGKREYERTRVSALRGAVLKTIDMGREANLMSKSLKDYISKAYFIDNLVRQNPLNKHKTEEYNHDFEYV